MHTISIGIPAYNEQINIKKLLLSLLKQKQGSFIISEIIVISDGSTDSTVQLVKSVNDSRVHCEDDGKRMGKALRQNQIATIYKGEALVLLDADIKIEDPNFIARLVEPIFFDMAIGLVAAKNKPALPKTMFEKIIHFGALVTFEIASQVHHGNNIYFCGGRARVFSKEFLKKYSWESVLSEDAYSYLACKKFGFTFLYEPEAEIFYKLPSTFKDHLNQSRRFAIGIEQLKKYFDPHLVAKEFYIPMGLKLRVTLKHLTLHPVLALGYLTILSATRILSLFSTASSGVWQPPKTSKKLN